MKGRLPTARSGALMMPRATDPTFSAWIIPLSASREAPGALTRGGRWDRFAERFCYRQ